MKSSLKNRLDGEIIFSFVILAYIAYILIVCLGYRSYTRYIPMIVGTVALVLIIIQIIKLWRSTEKREVRWDGYVVVFLWTLLCPVMIYVIGFQIGGPVYCFAFSKFWGKENWAWSIVPAIVIFAFLYFVKSVLSVPLWKGVIF